MMRSFLHLLVFKASCFLENKVGFEREREDDDLKKEKGKEAFVCMCPRILLKVLVAAPRARCLCL